MILRALLSLFRPNYAKAEVATADLRCAQGAGIEMVKFRFGHMAAGHCSYSRRMDGETVPISSAPALPPAECEHPDQCGCRWQAWIPLLDEME